MYDATIESIVERFKKRGLLYWRERYEKEYPSSVQTVESAEMK